MLWRLGRWILFNRKESTTALTMTTDAFKLAHALLCIFYTRAPSLKFQLLGQNLIMRNSKRWSAISLQWQQPPSFSFHRGLDRTACPLSEKMYTSQNKIKKKKKKRNIATQSASHPPDKREGERFGGRRFWWFLCAAAAVAMQWSLLLWRSVCQTMGFFFFLNCKPHCYWLRYFPGERQWHFKPQILKVAETGLPPTWSRSAAIETPPLPLLAPRQMASITIREEMGTRRLARPWVEGCVLL